MTNKEAVLKSIEAEYKIVTIDIETCEFAITKLSSELESDLLRYYGIKYKLHKRSLNELIVYLNSLLVELDKAKLNFDSFLAKKPLQ